MDALDCLIGYSINCEEKISPRPWESMDEKNMSQKPKDHMEKALHWVLSLPRHWPTTCLLYWLGARNDVGGRAGSKVKALPRKREGPAKRNSRLPRYCAPISFQLAGSCRFSALRYFLCFIPGCGKLKFKLQLEYCKSHHINFQQATSRLNFQQY